MKLNQKLRKLIKIMPLLCLLFITKLSYSQVTISGRVKEKGSGEVLPFASVLIKGTTNGVVANVDGFFSLVNVNPKGMVLIIRFVGYASVEYELKDESFIEVELEPLTDQLAEIIVMGDDNKVFDATSEISATTLSTRQLSLLPSVGEPDIFRSLQMLPGVSSTSESSSGLFVRGGTPDQNLTLLDGMTVYKVDHFFGFFSAFNTNAVKDVRLYKGAFPARYGGRMSGVVELTGKTGSFEKVQGGINLSLLSVGGHLEVPVGNKFSVFIAGRRSYSEVIKGGLYQDLIGNLTNGEPLDNTPLENATTITTDPDFYFYDWNSKLSYRPSDRDIIALSTYSGKDFLDESQTTSDLINEVVDVNYQLEELTDWGNRGASLKWSRQWSPQLYTNVLVAGSEYFSNYQRDEDVLVTQEDSVILDRQRNTFEDNNVIDLSFKADMEWQISLKSKAEFGFSYTHNDIQYDNIRDDTVVILDRVQEAYYASVYGAYETMIGDKFTLEGGLRITDYELSGELLYEPRINLTYDFNKDLKLKAAYGKHYQFANQIVNQNISEGSREFWLLSDGDLIDIGSAEHFVLGVTYQKNEWLFDIETYHKNLDGLAEFSLQFRRGPNESVEELFRIGEGVAKGVEVLVQKTLNNYTGWVSYTLSDIQNTFPDLNDGFAYRPLHYQRHEFKMVHSLKLGDWNLASNFIYGSGNPFSEPSNRYQIELLDGRTLEYIGLGARNTSFNPAYIRLDVSANYDFDIGTSRARLGLSFFNLLGRKNVWYTEYDFGQNPPLINQVNYLGFTPNLNFSLKF